MGSVSFRNLNTSFSFLRLGDASLCHLASLGGEGVAVLSVESSPTSERDGRRLTEDVGELSSSLISILGESGGFDEVELRLAVWKRVNKTVNRTGKRWVN